ncbi:MAG: acetoacetate decarboxylase family protein [Thermoleophilia bacterium]|nr:acetoacetate decarboxylase family protein [Thermoleophilia bacterium]
MRDTEIFTVVYASDRDALAHMVPAPLAVTRDLVIVHLYRMHDADWFGAYGESAVQIPVRHDASGTEGAYSPLLFVESDGAVAAGREIYGQPKKAGAIELRAEGDLLVGRVRRNTIDVLTATMPYKQVAAEPEDLERHSAFRTNLNLKAIPSADGSGAAVRELTARTLSDVVVHEAWRGPGTVELRPNAQAPVYRLPVRHVVEAFHWRADFTLVYATVLETIP